MRFNGNFERDSLMKVLNKKIWRDIKQNKSQFISIFLMTFLGVLAYAGVHAYMDGMRDSAARYYEKYNLQDLWVAGENFTEDDLEDIKNIDNVKDAERLVTITGNLGGYEDVTLELNYLESNNISKMAVIEGEGFDKDKQGVWLDYYLAKNLGIKSGDKVKIQYKTYEKEEEVLGLIEVPDHVYFMKDDSAIFPTHKDFGIAYLSITEFPKDYVYDELINNLSEGSSIFGVIDKDILKEMAQNFDAEDFYVYPYVIVDLEDTEKLSETKSEIENTIKPVKAVTTRDDSVSYMGYEREAEEGETYSGVFTFLFLFIAILSVVTTMYRFVRKQRIQIGTMKALGINRKKIIRHYISYGFWVSLFASVSGVLVGAITIGNFFLNMEMSYYEVPEYSITIIPSVYILAASTVLIITFITYLSCRTILKEKAADSIRVEVPKVKNSKFDITKLKIFKNSSLSTKWNLRDISRNKSRTLMAAFGVIGCTMILVCAFGMLDTMNGYLDWEFGLIYNFKYKLDLDEDISDKNLQKLEDDYGTKTSKTYGIELMDGEEKKVNSITINDAEDLFRYTGHNKEILELKDDGIFITEKLSVTLEKNVGDEITWHIFGEDEWYTSKIVGLNRDPQSQTLNMSRNYLKTLGLKYEPDTIYTNLDLSEVSELEGVDKITSIESIKDGMYSMIGVMYSMIVLLIFLSAVLGSVIIYNLGILSFAEKQYQFATLKVLGYKNKQIEKIFVKQNTWITVISVIIGLPLGYYMTAYIFTSALGEAYDFPSQIKILSYLYATIGTLVVSGIVNKFLSRKVKDIDMVTSLKGNE